MSENEPFKKEPEKKETANKDTFKHTLCYVPLGAIILFIVEKDKTETLKKHISYGIILFFGYLIFSFILSFLHIPLGGLLGLVYIAISVYLGFMAYNGKDVSVAQLDEIEKQIKKNM